MFISEFAVTSQSILLFLAGLILLAERAAITQTKSVFTFFTFLNADNDRASLEGVNEKTLLNCLTKNGRSLILLVGYIFAFTISAIFRDWYPSSAACNSTLSSMSLLNHSLSILMSLLVFILYYSSLLYYFISGWTCLSRLAEMLRNRLEYKDLERINLAKELTIVNCLHGILLFMVLFTNKVICLISTNWSTLLGYFIDVGTILVTIILFYCHECRVNPRRTIIK